MTLATIGQDKVMGEPGAGELRAALGRGFALPTPQGRLWVYGRANTSGRPLVFVHSVNAAASAYEVKPLFDAFADSRPVYAVDLPGFGRSERDDRPYTLRGMTDAVLACVDEVRQRHGESPVDAVGLSLGSEFVARAASERPGAFCRLALISPTGLEGPAHRGPAGSDRGSFFARAIFRIPIWEDIVFRLLTRPAVIRYFLRRTYGRRAIDPGLFEYAVETARQPGAKYAPLTFVTGSLFAADITDVYESLALPVWVAHGVRGDFVRYAGAKTLAEARDNWQLHVIDAGALPHFERPEEISTSLTDFFREVD